MHAGQGLRPAVPQHLHRPATRVCVAAGAGLDQIVPVRLVSHHLRLLGLLQRGPQRDLLVLVDYDAREDP